MSDVLSLMEQRTFVSGQQAINWDGRDGSNHGPVYCSCSSNCRVSDPK